MEKECISISRFLYENPNVTKNMSGLPDIGSRMDGNKFSDDIINSEKAVRVFYNEIKAIDKIADNKIPKNSLGGGSPASFPPFPSCCREIKRQLKSKKIHEYPLCLGDEKIKQKVVEYLANEGIVKSKNLANNGISPNNIIFTVSTTHAYTLILSTIIRPNDVVIVTGPNYALFTFPPEIINGTTRVLNLEEKDGWYVNPSKLANKIDEINAELKMKYNNKLSYIPRVKAFLNMNPHNPLGKVMNKKHYNRLKKIGEECKKRGVFLIDDVVYRDITYDRNDLAMPVSCIPGMFDNTITLFGISKSYGLASIRAGMVVANEAIISSIRNKIFQQMDAPPTLQGAAMAGAFNTTLRRNIEYKKYFNKVIKEYKFRYDIVKAIVQGIDSVSDKSLKNKIEKEIKKHVKNKDELNLTFSGMNNVKFVKGMEPEAGFFALLDFTNLKGKKYNEYTITDEIELLKFFYKYVRVKFYVGQSMAWPNKDELVARITFALARKDLVRVFYYISKGEKMLE